MCTLGVYGLRLRGEDPVGLRVFYQVPSQVGKPQLLLRLFCCKTLYEDFHLIQHNLSLKHIYLGFTFLLLKFNATETKILQKLISLISVTKSNELNNLLTLGKRLNIKK